MLSIEYDRRQLLIRMAVFQGIPLISIGIAMLVAAGLMEVRYGPAVPITILSGIALYLLIMVLLVRAYLYPVLLSIDNGGVLRWRPAFKVHAINLPAGTEVTVDRLYVALSPEVSGIPINHSINRTTVIKMPKAALKPIASRRLIVGDV